MTVRVYKSTDASAPVLTGQAGSLIAVLDACLVTGYGSKTAAGWTKPFTGTNKAVFKPGLGAPNHYKVDDSGFNTSYTSAVASIQMFTSMTDVDTGENPSPATIASTDNNTRCWFVKAEAANTTARKWNLIANEKSCWVFIEYGSPGYAAHFFGSYSEFNSDYSPNNGVIIMPAASLSNSLADSYNPLNELGYAHSNASSKGFMMEHNFQYSVSCGIFRPFSYQEHGIQPSKNNTVILLPIFVRTTTETDISTGALLGTLPGAFCSQIRTTGNDSEVVFSGGDLINKNYLVLVLKSYSTDYFSVYINIDSNGW